MLKHKIQVTLLGHTFISYTFGLFNPHLYKPFWKYGTIELLDLTIVYVLKIIFILHIDLIVSFKFLFYALDLYRKNIIPDAIFFINFSWKLLSHARIS